MAEFKSDAELIEEMFLSLYPDSGVGDTAMRVARMASEIRKARTLQRSTPEPVGREPDAMVHATHWKLLLDDSGDLTVHSYNAARVESARQQGREGPPWPVWIGTHPPTVEPTESQGERDRDWEASYDDLGESFLSLGAEVMAASEMITSTKGERTAAELDSLLADICHKLDMAIEKAGELPPRRYLPTPPQPAVVERDVEVRLNEDGTVDEIVGTGFFHLEELDDGLYWMALTPHGDDGSGRTAWTILAKHGALTVTEPDPGLAILGEEGEDHE